MLQEHRQQLMEAVSAHKSGRIDAAQKSYLSLRSLYPQNFDVVHLLGLTYFQVKNYSRSLAVIKEAIELNPSSAMAHSNLGNVYKSLGDFQSALASYDRALSLNREFIDARYNRGNAQYALNNPDGALKDYEHVLRQQPGHYMAMIAMSNVLRERGEMEQALQVVDRALSVNPTFAEAISNRGNILADLGRYDEASQCLDRAIKLKPNYPDAHYNMGNLRLKRQEYEMALASYNTAISLKSDYAEAFGNRGNALKELRRISEALASYDKAINLKPDYAEAHNNRGNALKELNRIDEALEAYGKAISLKRDYAEAHSNYGNALADLNRLDEALASHDMAIRLKPGYAEAHSNRGNVLARLSRLDEALASFDKAISLKSDSAEAYSNRGNVLADLDLLDEALASHDRAISLSPDYAEAHGNRGKTLADLNRLDEALASYDKAISLKPDFDGAKYNKSILCLQRGALLEGFELQLSRWDNRGSQDKAPATTVPLWDGVSLNGDLLLWAEQGIGDEVFYASMLSLLDSGKHRISLSADKRLHPIYARSFEGIRLIDRRLTSRSIPNEFQAQSPIGNLGHLLKVDERRIVERNYPYLMADAHRSDQIKRSFRANSERPLCGISWKSGNKTEGKSRSIQLVDLEPLWRCEHIDFVNLQYGEVASDIATVKQNYGRDIGVVPGLDTFNDLDGLLALMEVCDIVFTIDNVTAHLAGAIGKKSVVLVPLGRGRYWYWGGESPSRWYPSLNLVYQERVGDWATSIENAVQLTRQLLAAH